MADVIELEIVTPERLLVHEQVESVEIPGKAGEIGVLPGHAPLITELTIGEISYKHGVNSEHLSVAWGFAEILPQKVTILAQTAERPQDIDVKRAQEAKARAEAVLQKAAPDLDFEAALNALRRAEVRLKVSLYASGVTATHEPALKK